MKIVIETIPHRAHRYETVGDYWIDPDGTLQIRVSQMADDRMAALVAIHELVEVTLTEHRGISEASIMKFDTDHPELDDPGHSPEAPYHHEHVFAEIVERQVAHELGVNWQEYEKAIEAL